MGPIRDGFPISRIQVFNKNAPRNRTAVETDIGKPGAKAVLVTGRSALPPLPVSDDLAVDHIDNIFADVGGKVGNPFETT